MRITPKSGSPVFGHIEVNSGQSIAISNSRSGRGFGNVSIVDVDIDDQSTLTALRAGVSIRPTLLKARLRLARPALLAPAPAGGWGTRWKTPGRWASRNSFRTSRSASI